MSITRRSVITCDRCQKVEELEYPAGEENLTDWAHHWPAEVTAMNHHPYRHDCESAATICHDCLTTDELQSLTTRRTVEYPF